nr:transcriptional adapter ada2 [Quercus suber]
MGRSRGNFHSPDEDPTQRSRRKKNANSGENSESAAAGQGTSEGKRALYHCNYCNKDITGKIRIKCFNCPDFDLCIECFSVGAEVQPHKSNHPYRVMDNLSFPLICPDWNADDEILLLEGIEMYGMGNWAEVAEHVGTKSKEQCIDHYTNKYKNSPYFPLPDMSHVVGKNRKELLAMAKGHSEDKKGQGTSEGKRALYHCNYCNKDITGKIRIKCFNCPDFDLCIECFSVGAEVQPHKSNHPYRVMDNLSFPLICPDWNADDEILLLEGIEMYGMGNWAEVAEHVGTKSKEQCIDHYTNKYKNSPYFPLPDMSHVVGKNRKELLAMAKGHSEDKKGFPMMGELNLKEESPFSPSRVKVEESHKGGSSSRLLSSLNAEVESGVRSSSSSSAATAANKKASNMAQVKDGPGVVKVEDHQADRSFEGKRPHSSLLAEMEFKDTDTEDERELKLRVLRIYAKRLDERKHRKDFILERNLLYPNHFEKDL